MAISPTAFIAIIATVFCAALILSQAISRPRVIVQSDRGEEARGCLMPLAVLLLMSVGFILVLLRHLADSPSDGRIQQVKKSEMGQLKSQETAFVIEPSQEGEPLEEKTPPLNNDPRWVVLIKRCANEAEAKSLKKSYPEWDMKKGEVNGKFWVFIFVENELEGREKSAELSSLQRTDLELKVMRANVKRDEPKIVGNQS